MRMFEIQDNSYVKWTTKINMQIKSWLFMIDQNSVMNLTNMSKYGEILTIEIDPLP